MTEQKKTATRVYVVIDKETQKPIGLIEAISEAKARAHHSNKTVEVRYAEQKDVFDAAKEGVEIETAGNGE